MWVSILFLHISMYHVHCQKRESDLFLPCEFIGKVCRGLNIISKLAMLHQYIWFPDFLLLSTIWCCVSRCVLPYTVLCVYETRVWTSWVNTQQAKLHALNYVCFCLPAVNCWLMQMSPTIVVEEISQNFLLANESVSIHIKNYAIFCSQ